MSWMFPFASQPAPAQSVWPSCSDEPFQDALPQVLPSRSRAALMADPFFSPCGELNGMVGLEPAPVFNRLPAPGRYYPSEHVNPGMMPPSMLLGFNGGFFPGGDAFNIEPCLPVSTPTMLRHWVQVQPVTKSKSSLDSCRPCQYVGVFVFLCVISCIGFAVYNGGMSCDETPRTVEVSTLIWEALQFEILHVCDERKEIYRLH